MAQAYPICCRNSEPKGRSALDPLTAVAGSAHSLRQNPTSPPPFGPLGSIGCGWPGGSCPQRTVGILLACASAICICICTRATIAHLLHNLAPASRSSCDFTTTLAIPVRVSSMHTHLHDQGRGP